MIDGDVGRNEKLVGRHLLLDFTVKHFPKIFDIQYPINNNKHTKGKVRAGSQAEAAAAAVFLVRVHTIQARLHLTKCNDKL